MDDANIIALFYARNESAITETVSKYGGYCGKIAGRILQAEEDVEECLNDTWLQAWNSIPPQEPNILRVYLGSIVRNCSINLYNRLHAQKRNRSMELMLSELESCLPSEANVEKEIESKLLGQVISQWLAGLELRDRRLFLQRYWYGYEVKLLAREHGCTANAMASRLKRLRKSLKEQLEQEELLHG